MWRTTTLGECCEIVSGATPATSEPSFWDGDIEWVTPKDLSELDGKYIRRTARRITKLGLENCAATILPPNSVLFSSRAPIGHLAVNSVPMATNQGFKSLVPKTDEVDAGFLYHWLRANRAFLESLGNGATFKEVSKAVVSRVQITLPPLDEQRHIAEILDKADATRRQRKETIALIEDLQHSAFLEMVGPGAADYAAWSVRSVESLAAVHPNAMRTGPFGSDLLHSEFVDRGIAVLGIDNAVQNRFAWGERRFVTAGKYERLRRYTVFPGDVIVTIMGTTGRSAVVPDDIPTAITTKHLATITLDRSQAESEFISQALFRHPDVLRQITAANRGAIMSGLNLGLIKRLRVPVPPIHRQREFSQVTARIRAMTDRLETARDTAGGLFESLVARAFQTSKES
jgi:type I restriction enzyme S subunit